MFKSAMISLRPDTIQSVLCIGAHSDDIEIGCGGTILKLLQQNPALNIHWVVLSGNGVRAGEARRSAEIFLESANSARTEVLEFQDARFPYTEAEEIKDYFAALSGSANPDLVFTHRREDMHQDHRLIAELTWQHFRDHMILEYEIPKYEGDLGQPNVFVSLSAEMAKRKIDAIISSFKSQNDKPWFRSETFEAMLRLRGIECQSSTGLAEAFHSRKLCLM